MRYFIFFLSFFITTASWGQGSWKQLSKSADKLYKTGQYAKAAKKYEAAWNKKKNKKELIFKAGECYYALKDYHKAADAYSHIKRDVDKFGLAGLKYGRSLKQAEQYIEAKNELEYFLRNYKKADKTVVSKIVTNEIKGCDLAIDLQERENQSKEIIIQHLTKNINSPSAEFAPLPYSDDILYFSSTIEGKARIFRSQRMAGEWTPAVKPNLPEIEGHVCNGTFSPDNQRFYFNVCNTNERWQGLSSKCDIYLTIRKSNNWAPPIKLRDYVKMEGTTAVHPHVAHQGKMEILYFSSDRPGGKGGLDIWFMTRPIDSGDIDFTLPKNAGPDVNTVGDEVTPFYDLASKTLYFSSNGQVTIGGYDIFKAKGEKNNWSSVNNMETPINSPGDDYYYSFNPAGGDALFVSNRLFGLEKISSTNADIFSVSSPKRELIAKGKIIAKNNNELIKDVMVKLYEIKSDGRQRLLDARTFPDGNYSFGLIPDRDLRIIAEPEGFAKASFDFDTREFENEKSYGKDLILDKASMVNQTSRQPVTTTTTPPRKTNTTSPRVIQRPVSTPSPINSRPATPPVVYKEPTKTYTPTTTTNATVYRGEYYKVQLKVVVRFNDNDPQFREAKQMGHLDTENLPAKGWIRVLLADFFSVSEARKAMLKAHQLGFKDAFLVRYKNGIRKTP